ncbi:MAG: ORF6N domain-containing protein [Bacteroidales bacterium]|nr:ORF6N domain-containing protein [Bacteroidales bacterium]
MEQLDHIQNLIYIIRGQRVMLDYDLARIYQVETKSLNQAVKRNIKRFEGEEFMFQLSKEEWNAIKTEIKKSYDINNQDITVLRSQFVTAKSVQKQRFQPYAFTEIGVAMLSSVLRSEVAIYANRRIMKAFVSYRHMTEMPLAATYLELRKQIEDLRSEVNEILADQNEINELTRAQLDAISTVLSELQAPASSVPSRPIGFIRPTEEEDHEP